jgi:hypothetical protein
VNAETANWLLTALTIGEPTPTALRILQEILSEAEEIDPRPPPLRLEKYHAENTGRVGAPGAGSRAPRVVLLLGARCCEHLVGPALVDVLEHQMSLVGAVVPADSRKALPQGLELLQSMGPLGLALTRHGGSPTKGVVQG